MLVVIPFTPASEMASLSMVLSFFVVSLIDGVFVWFGAQAVDNIASNNIRRRASARFQVLYVFKNTQDPVEVGVRVDKSDR